jgi:DNA-binding MarR family transcriptional regulator
MDRNANPAVAARESDWRESAGGTRLGVLDGNIAFHLRLAQDASFKAFKKYTGESELRPGWYAVMEIINRNPGITPMALSRASGRDKSTLTPILRELTRYGLVDQCPVATDRRSYALTLTVAGEERLARLAEHAETHDRRLDEIVGPGKQELIALLRRIANLLD